MTTFTTYSVSDTGHEEGSGHLTAHFPYWSFTKTVIAICALKLQENGVLDLDAPLDDAPYTLRQLLAHTAGVPDYGALAAYHDAVSAGEEPWSRDVLLDAALTKGMLFAPGGGWSYSNVGYMLARECIEAAAQKSFAALVDEDISQPLGLTSVQLATTREQFAALHCACAGQYHPGWVYHGCLTGTAPDAARLLHALFTGKLLTQSSLARMQHRYPLGGAIDGRPWTACGYGLGLMSGAMGELGQVAGHTGGGPSCVNAVYHFPEATIPLTVACFAGGDHEGVVEYEAGRVAGGKS